MKLSSCFRPISTTNGSVRTDLPLMVVPRANKKMAVDMVRPGQLVCIGDIFLKTNEGLVRIKAA